MILRLNLLPKSKIDIIPDLILLLSLPREVLDGKQLLEE